MLLKVCLFLHFLLSFISLMALAVDFTSSAELEEDRRIWSTCAAHNGTQTCTCGNNLQDAILCSDDGNTIQIQPCYCIFYDKSENKTLAGNCMSTCYNWRGRSINRYSIENGSLFNRDMCSSVMNIVDTHREGRFCGRCKEGFGLAVYSYHYTSCIPCTDYGYKNWLKYFAVALLPLTIFYCIVVLLKINVMSSRLCGSVFGIQCLTSPIQLRIFDGWIMITELDYNLPRESATVKYLNILFGVLGIVNLDFFRGVYPYFCLHPKLNILHVVSLEFLVALYPFLLIFLTYLLVSAYDKNCCLLVWAWKPFKWCLEHYQRRFNVRGSLIETFGTFILLSNVKILVTCFDILLPTRAYNEEGLQLKEKYLYYDANIKYFSSEHLPFALLALFVGFVFVLLPFLLLLLYPCRCFQKLLNSFGWRCQALHIFMDAFQGSYRTEPRDLRFCSAYYLLLRFLFLFPLAFNAYYDVYLSIVTFLMLVGAIFFAAFHPYRHHLHNRFDIIVMLVMIMVCSTHSSDMIAAIRGRYQRMFAKLFSISYLFVMVVAVLPILSFFVPFQKLSSIISKFRSTVRKDGPASPLIDPLDRENRRYPAHLPL